ncbi:MAG TPA: SUMF1/EgtB/PvdO family nonheme iron enzyme [Gemmataceae bacterium]|nr:SUMF1/EgtB/PvdO family nonheme iron enzyme [Gemmataceae bacterium]
MIAIRPAPAFVAGALWLTVLTGYVRAGEPAPAKGGQITLKGSLVCNGACVPAPKDEDHVMVLFAIGGTDEVRAEVARVVKDGYPEKGLDADAAGKLMDQFSARLKYYLDPESPALKGDRNKGKNHYCQAATASAVTGTVAEKGGKRWITATRIEATKLKYPDRMLEGDKPFAKCDKEPLTIKINDKISLKCVYIPPGKFLMGTPFYMWPYFQEEYPHPVTLTRPFYMAEIPVTQEMYEAVMGDNPSAVKDPRLPVQNPRFAEVKKFCDALSERNKRVVRLPTDAEWEYAARVGTSNPGFAEKYKGQNSSGPDGFKAPLKVRSKKPNAWGLYDMASCWWEITADKGMYNVRHAEEDPRHPPAADNPKTQRSGRGIIKDNWSIGTHEFITEKADYAGQKFRVVVEAGPTATGT